MTKATTATISALFICLLVVIGAAEAWQLRQKIQASLTDNPPAILVGTPKAQNIDAMETLAQHFTIEQDTDIQAVIVQVLPETVQASGIKLLDDTGEYAGIAVWVDTVDVKDYFINLKEALLPAFSLGVERLRDETHQEPGQPVRNILSFRDPGISPDSFTFIRIRDRLYEIHMAPEKEHLFSQAIEELTQ